ncbi:MAG: DUF2339 domain-containing protein [Ferruginibacter sp.]
MEILTLLLLIIIVILLVNQNGNFSKQIDRLGSEIHELRILLYRTKKEEEEKSKTDIEKKYWQSGFKEEKIILPVTKEPETVKPAAAEEPVIKIITEEVPVEKIEIPETILPPVQTQKQTPQIEVSPSFFERHPDMEKFIGENLVSKIGIAVLVLAIGFFVKYAIDQNWIGPAGRVAIGILCGAVLIAVAHRLRNIYTAFSSVLAGGGLAVFYFTIYLAYQQFQLFSQPVAFSIMIFITVFAVILSLLYNRQELAVIALLGGFAAPFLVSNGNSNYNVLFTYVAILNSGLLIIAYNKSWRLLNLLSFIFTIVLFSGWLFTLDTVQPVVYQHAFIFATIFYLLFFVINIAHNIKENKKFIVADFGILLANTSLYFAVGIFLLNEMNATEYKGFFSIAMAVFNLTASFFFFRKRKVDTNILYLLIGITLTFVSITAPIQLSGNNITLFWSSEAVLLYWLYKKSQISIIRYSSFLIWGMMLISLAMDWIQVYSNYAPVLPVIINKGFITTLFAALATYLLFVLQVKEKGTTVKDVFVPGPHFFRVLALLILFAAGALEINYQFQHYYPESKFYILYLLLYTIVYINIFALISQKVKALKLNWQFVAGILSAGIVLYLLSLPAAFETQFEILSGAEGAKHFFAHWLTVVMIGLSFYRLILLLKNNRIVLKQDPEFIYWIICIAVVIYLSAELSLLANTLFHGSSVPVEEIQRVYIKAGLPILWGLSSFAFMWLGMKFKFRMLRIVSLSLFTITLLKLFIFDIRNIPAAGKIAAFFCLGILLLVVSFMYQRLKKIIIDDEEKKL